MKDGMHSHSASYQLFMLVLCVYALAALAIERMTTVQPEVKAVLNYADHAICVIFFADFCTSLWQAQNRWRYLATWGWLDLLSSVPMINAARWGRLARVARIFRVLRGLRAAKILSTLVLQRRAENSFLAASLLAILLIIFCSTAILHFENAPDSNIKTAEDAIWWAFATITTVGYGDRFPVTSEGRFVAALLMCAGVGLFSTFSGLLAAWFLAPDMTGGESETVALHREVKALREVIERMQARIDRDGIPSSEATDHALR